jgi:SulP family sulfate permease
MSDERSSLLRPGRRLLPFRELFPQPAQDSPSSLLAALRGSVASFLGDALSLRGARLLEWVVRYDDARGAWAFTYTREKLLRDLLASTVIASLLVPQSMSYALLLGVPVQYGLYSAVVRWVDFFFAAATALLFDTPPSRPAPHQTPTFMYSLFASVSCTQFGIVAPTSILANNMGATLTGLPDGLNGDKTLNGDITPAAAAANQLFITTQIQLAFACGVVFLAMLALRLTWVANLISPPVLNGFTWGSAGLIVASQLKDLFGFKPATSPTTFGGRMANAVNYIGKANPGAALLGSICLLLLLYAKDVRIPVGGRVLQLHKLTPVPLILIVLTCGISYGMDLNGKYGVPVVGTIPSNLPPFFAPFTADAAGAAAFSAVLPQAVLLSIVGLVQTLGVGSAFMERRNELLVPWREVAGSAAAHLVGCTFSSVTTSGSITRTAVAFDAGAASPACGLFVGVIILLAITFLTPFLKYLPMCVLAAVVTSSTRNLFDLTEMRRLLRGKLSDFTTMIFTIAMLLWQDVQYGLFAGIAFSMLTVLYRAFKPRVVEVAALPGTECFVAIERFPEARRAPGALVYRLDGEVSFGNAALVEAHMMEVLRAAAEPAPPAAAAPLAPPGGLPASPGTHPALSLREGAAVSGGGGGGEGEAVMMPAAPSAAPPLRPGLRMRACYALSSAPSVSNLEAAPAAAAEPASAPPPASTPPPSARAVIFDLSRVVSVDVAGAKMLGALIKAFKKRRVLLLLAALPGPVRDTLARYAVCEDAAAAPPAAPPPAVGCWQAAARACGGAAPLAAAPPPGPAASAPAHSGVAFTHYLTIAAALVAAAEAGSAAADGGA